MKDLKLASKDLTILYAEDDINTQNEISDILRLLFKDVFTADDGEDALIQYKQHPEIDLILTDINMPKLNGIDLVRTIRAEKDSIPIIVLSAHSEVDYFLDTIKLGINGYILKPIDIQTFTVVLQNVLNGINLKKENDAYKINLENKVQEEIQKRLYQEKILMQQSKLAAMGEMIDAIAHQWKQPLNIMAMHADMLQYDYEDGYINKEYIDTYRDKFTTQLNHAVDTLDSFRKFFRPDTQNKQFSISDAVDSVLVLVHDEFMKNTIKVEKNILKEYTINGNENEFKHLILNIINNAKDAFNEKDIQERVITLSVKKEQNSLKFEIEDNAGGIASHIINDIFKPNTTTKPIGKGTGIGLYMSAQIAKKLHGELSVQNNKNGAKFIFEKVDG